MDERERAHPYSHDVRHFRKGKYRSMKLRSRKSSPAFTILETMMAVGSTSIMMAALITAGVTLQRSFAAIEGYSISEADPLRGSDYIALDVRRALSASVANGTLTLTIPNYYNP